MFSGPNRGGGSTGDRHIAIELLGEGISVEEFDVELGGSRRRLPRSPHNGPPRSRVRTVLGGAAVATVLIGGIVWLSSSRNSAVDDSTQPSTTLRQTTTTVQPGSGVVSTLAQTTPTSPPATILESVVINVGSPIVDLEGSTAVYLVDESNWQDVYRLDQLSGVIQPWTDGSGTSGPVAAITGTPEAPRIIRSFSTLWVRPNSDGTSWQSDYSTLKLVGVDGSTLRTIEPPWLEIGSDWIEFLGTNAESNPVIAGIDGSSFAVQPDDSLVRINEGYLTSIDRGHTSEVVCTDDALCQRVLTTSFGTVGSPGTGDNLFGFGPTESISPDGRWAIEELIDESGNPVQWLVSFETGTRSAINIGSQGFGNGGNSGAVLRSNWTADSTHYVSRRRSERFEDPIILTVLDAATGSLSGYPLPPAFGALVPIAVL